MDALEKAARFLRRELGATRIVYLGTDGALDRVVQGWAEELVGPEAADDALCRRATDRCLHADPAAIDEYLAQERERANLRMFESLPGDATRVVELLAGKVAVMIFDKAYLTEEDILPATWLLFGKSDEPLVKRIGRRWFLAPGSFPTGGVLLVDDQDAEGGLRVTSYSGELVELHSEQLELTRELNLRVTGGS